MESLDLFVWDSNEDSFLQRHHSQDFLAKIRRLNDREGIFEAAPLRCPGIVGGSERSREDPDVMERRVNGFSAPSTPPALARHPSPSLMRSCDRRAIGFRGPILP